MGESSSCDVLFEYDFRSRVLVDGKEYSVTPPALRDGARVGYGFIYFTGQSKGSLTNQILFMIADYDTPREQLFVDGNNNLDLSDDEPWGERAKDGTFLVHLHARESPDHHFSVQLRSFRDRPKDVEMFEEVLGEYIKRMGGKATKSKYWFSEQRLNTMAADIKIGEISFQIGANDYDCNGSYSNRGSDRILVGNSGAAILSDQLSDGATTLDVTTLICVQSQVFEIAEVDPAGKWLTLKPSDKPCDRLGPGMNLPSQPVELLNGETRDLSSYAKPDRYLLLDFWGSWCQPCIVSIPELQKLQKKWEGRLTVLGLHFGNSDSARQIIQKKGVGWDQAVATKDLQKRFYVDSWPYYVLVGPDGRILGLNVQLLEVESILGRSADEGRAK